MLDNFLRKLKARAAWLASLFWSSQTATMMSSALLVGALAGLGTVLFRKAVDLSTAVLFEASATWFAPARLSLVILPALGGLAVGAWLHILKPRGPGQGVAGIIEAAAFHGGRIDPLGSLARVIGAVITIGTGGSAGPEDPSVQVGALVGSQVGRLFRMGARPIRTLVGCGAAAGIAAAFNAPISGVFFAVEIILAEFSGISVSYIVIAAVAGAAVSQVFLGSRPAFTLPGYELRSPFELILYFVLGIVAAFVGVAYTLALDRVESIFGRWEIPGWLKPALGGLAVGLMAFLWRPDFMGTGYSQLQSMLANPANDAILFFGLVVFKLLATSLTIGSGGQGGLFAPSLFLGGMLGLGFGTVAGAALPGVASPPGAYGMVAMGAVLASAVRAPIVAILLPFEMTNDYRIILPLMASVVSAYAVAQWLERESVYSIKLRARGVDLSARHDVNIMRLIPAGDAMTRDFPTVEENLPLRSLGDMFTNSGHHGFPVLDPDGRLIGIVTIGDYERSVQESGLDGSVADIMTHDPVTAFPDESLEEVLTRCAGADIGRVPVVDPRDPRKLLGVLRRSDILRAYGNVLGHRAKLKERIAQLGLGLEGTIHFLEIEIPRGGSADGCPISELTLPDDAVLVAIRRRGRTLIPHGHTILEAGDRVTAFVSTQGEQALKEGLLEKKEVQG